MESRKGQQTRREFLGRLVVAGVGASASTAGYQALGKNPGVGQDMPCSTVKSPLQDLNGKVAFITGGSSGIGLGIARACVDAGMRVIIAARGQAQLDDAMVLFKSAQGRVHPVTVDVTDRAGLENAAAEAVRIFGKVHVLLNNAGVAASETLSRTTYEDWDWLMNINLNGVFNGIRAFLPRIQVHGEGGHILTTSSILGLFAASDGGMAAYSASKFAVVGLMEALRGELATTNIGVSVFCPGMVRSNIWQSSANSRPASGANAQSRSEEVTQQQKMQQDPAFAMDPLEVGRLVIRGMRQNDMYILTHPEYEPILRDRSEALLASVPMGLRATKPRDEMVQQKSKPSIYSAERSRKLCTTPGKKTP